MSQIKILSHPDPNKQLYLQTDSSYIGVAAVIFQISDSGQINVLQFASRLVKGPEKNYSTVEIEAVALLFAMSKWQIYFLGRKFVIRTDNYALTFLKTCRPSNSRLIRFMLYLQQFDYETEHVKGSENFLADFLSRFPQNPDREPPENNFTVQVYRVNIQKSLITKMSQIARLQDNEVKIKLLKDSITMGPQPDNKKYKILNGILFKLCYEQWLIVLPECLLNEVLIHFHDFHGHFGVKRTYSFFARVFYYPKIKPIIKKFVKVCEICQKCKYNNKSMNLDFRSIKTTRPNEILSSDLFGPLLASRGQVQYVLVLYDVFSKLVTFYPLKKATTRAILNRYEKYFNEIAKPSCILSDRGTQYTAKLYTKFLDEQGVRIAYTSVRHPQANPVERIMAELGRLCRSYCSESHVSWAFHIKEFENWINSSVNFVTQMSPKLLHFGHESNEIKDIITFPPTGILTHQEILIKARINLNLHLAYRKKKNEIMGPKTPDFLVNDLVLLRTDPVSSAGHKETKKFFPLYDGPFLVKKVIHCDTYVLKFTDSDKERGIFIRRFLKKFHTLA
jgi:hypothetical protein